MKIGPEEPDGRSFTGLDVSLMVLEYMTGGAAVPSLNTIRVQIRALLEGLNHPAVVCTAVWHKPLLPVLCFSSRLELIIVMI